MDGFICLTNWHEKVEHQIQLQEHKDGKSCSFIVQRSEALIKLNFGIEIITNSNWRQKS